MSKRLIIFGGGGHAKVVADIAMNCGYQDIAFLDDAPIEQVMGFPVLGKTGDAEKFENADTEFIIAIGNNYVREKIAASHNLHWATLVHPSAQIGCRVTIGEGTVVMANAVINVCTVVGKHCIINTAAVIEHDNQIGDFVHISPNAALGGTVFVGNLTHIGIGSAVTNNIKICPNSTIGAGAVVVKNIEESGIYVGVPARKIK